MITAVDNVNKTVTIEDSVSLSTGKSWAIGGKRLTLQADTSRLDIVDAKAGWTLELTTGTDFDVDYKTTIPAGDATNGGVTIQGSEGLSPKPRLVSSVADSTFIGASGSTFRRLRYTNDNQVYRMLCYAAYGCLAYFEDIEADSPIATAVGDVVALNCHCTGRASQTTSFFGISNTGSLRINNCSFTNLYGPAIDYAKQNTNSVLQVNGCLFEGRGSVVAITITRDITHVEICNNTFYDCVDGIDYYAGTWRADHISTIKNNIFSECSGYGIAVSGSAPIHWRNILIRNNRYYNCTSGFAEGGTLYGNVELTGDPFTDAANGDFSLNGTASAGAACRSVGYPTDFDNDSTVDNWLDVGAFQVKPAVVPAVGDVKTGTVYYDNGGGTLTGTYAASGGGGVPTFGGRAVRRA